MKHSMNTRMNFIRAANSDARLSQRQRLLLSTLVTYMPFDSEEGWALETSALAEAFYRSKEQVHIKNVRLVLRELEDLGAIERVYDQNPKSRHACPTFFVNWDWLLAPFRKANKTPQAKVSKPVLDTPAQGAYTPQPEVYPLISTQSTHVAGVQETPRLRVVK